MVIWALIYLLATLAVLFGTFVFLCAVLKLLDVTLNMLLSLPLLEPPQEWLTTDRIKRLKHGGNDWQRACSRWLCRQLDALDDNHCGGT